MKMKEQTGIRQGVLKVLALSILMILSISLLTPAKAYALEKMGTITLNPGKTKQLTVKVSGEAGITWSSSDPAVCATINTSGLIQAYNSGKCYIYAKVNGGKNYRWTVKVPTLKINKKSLTLLKKRDGSTLKLTPKAARKEASWTSSNPKVATVSSSGKVTPRNTGNTLITATWGNMTVSCSVQVLAPSPSSLRKFYPVKQNKGKVILAGSSLFDHWSSFQTAFGSTKVINNSYHSALITDFLKNYKKLITSYNPKAVVLCLGTDELHQGLATPEECAENMQKLISRIHKKSKKTKIFYVAIPLYAGRSEVLWDRVKTYNSLMKTYCSKHKKYVTYLNLAGKLMKNGKPVSSMFAQPYAHGNLFLTTKGYKAAKSVIVKKVRKAAKK